MLEDVTRIERSNGDDPGLPEYDIDGRGMENKIR